jgi:SPP1 family predicted phage head-tail adaptor
MKAGSLDRRVVLERPTSAPDGMGGTENGWQAVAEVWAHFLYLRGGETVLAGRLEGRLTMVATIRASSDTRPVTAAWRLRDAREGTIWNVRAVIPSDDRGAIELTCESGVAT